MTTNALQAVLDKAAAQEPGLVKEPAVRRAPKPANRPAPKARAAVEPVEISDAPAAPKFHRPSRDNRRFVGGHFDPAVGKQLRLIAVEDETTVQALLEQALDLLFVKKGRQKIADLERK